MKLKLTYFLIIAAFLAVPCAFAQQSSFVSKPIQAAWQNDDRITQNESVSILRQVNLAELPESPNFSVEHGFYNSSFDLIVAWDVPNAVIRYTLDGSNPLESATKQERSSPVTIHISPNSTTDRAKTPAVTVRAVALVDGVTVTNMGGSTYIFIENVKLQKNPGEGFPTTNVNGQYLDWSMDSDVVNDSRYQDLIDDALLSIPSISIATELANLFDPATGIYVNAMLDGREWERPASIELIDPNHQEPGFQINGGLRIRGGWSRHPEDPKHAFRLFFRSEYGKARLDYPLFGDEGGKSFDCVDLRTAQNYSWSYKTSSGAGCIMIRDVFSRDCQRDMGQPYTRSRAYHLFLNGMYWGLFQTQERSEADFAASYFGGDALDYDVIKKSDAGTVEATDGDLDAYYALWNVCRSGFTTSAAYFKVQGKNADGSESWTDPVLLNVDNLIDYLLIIFYTGNFDSPVSAFMGNQSPNNIYGVYDRLGRTGFLNFIHDAEHSLMNPDYSELGYGEYGQDRTGPFSLNNQKEYFNPQAVHQKLMVNGEYQMRFADRVYRHCFNQGALTRDMSRQRFTARRDEIDMAIIAESARWGDAQVHPARTKDNDWLPAINWVMDTFFSDRTQVLLEQLKADDLYPALDPPVFQHELQEVIENSLFLTAGSTIRLLNNNSGKLGIILYTLDGSDPRAIGGATATSVRNGGNQIDLTLSTDTILKARIKNNSTWSALHELSIHTGEDLSGIRITEIHYRPLLEGTIPGTEFEFIELKNCGASLLHLSESRFINGIDYTFTGEADLPAGGFVVLASNAGYFRQRYGFAPFGEYLGQLENAGERLTLMDAAGDTVLSVRYNDKAPWPEEPDTLGYSLVAKEKEPQGDPNEPSYWRTSFAVNGSPGADDIASGVDNRTNQSFEWRLEPNFPNPFNPETKFRFAIPRPGRVKIKILDVLGREVATLTDGLFATGVHELSWQPQGLPSGIYFCRMESGSFQQVQKLTLLK